MNYSNTEIDVADIVSISPDLNRMMLIPRQCYAELASNLSQPSIKFYVIVDDVDSEAMGHIRFEYINHLKTLPDPKDRVADFEWKDMSGAPDFDRLDELIEQRKTSAERQKDIDECLELIRECEEKDIDCESIKQSLRDKLMGV